jgi:hypothetical protein
MQQLLALADELGLTVSEKRGRHAGGYHHGSRTVRLDPGLPRRVARSVLAHEIAHHVFGDTTAAHGPARARQERRANEWAAMRLISLDAYAAAERMRDGHAPSMAHDLCVTTELVEAFRALLARIGDTTYVQAKMGAGQFALKADVP